MDAFWMSEFDSTLMECSWCGAVHDRNVAEHEDIERYQCRRCGRVFAVRWCDRTISRVDGGECEKVEVNEPFECHLLPVVMERLVNILKPIGATLSVKGRLELNLNVRVNSSSEAQMWRVKFKAIEGNLLGLRREVEAESRDKVAWLRRRLAGHSVNKKSAADLIQEIQGMYNQALNSIDECTSTVQQCIQTIDKNK